MLFAAGGERLQSMVTPPACQQWRINRAIGTGETQLLALKDNDGCVCWAYRSPQSQVNCSLANKCQATKTPECCLKPSLNLWLFSQNKNYLFIVDHIPFSRYHTGLYRSPHEKISVFWVPGPLLAKSMKSSKPPTGQMTSVTMGYPISSSTP